MASQERSPADPLDPLAARLASEGHRFGFVRAVSLIERLAPHAARVGGEGPLADEAIRFRHDPALVFSTSDVTRIRVREGPAPGQGDGGDARALRFEVTTSFLGLTGAVSPLPMYIAEEVVGEDPDEASRRDFLDLFHHRLISLFYRARTRLDFASDFTGSGRDVWSRRVLALAGIDVQAAPTGLPLWCLLRLAPLLARRARTADALETALLDVLGASLGEATVRVEQFAGVWVPIDAPEQMLLGVSKCLLGEDTTLGVAVFDRAGKFRVAIGPLTAPTLRRLSPGGDLLPVVRAVVSLFCRDDLTCDLDLELGPDAGAALRLGDGATAVLGESSWLGQRSEHTRVTVALPNEAAPVTAALMPPPPGFMLADATHAPRRAAPEPDQASALPETAAPVRRAAPRSSPAVAHVDGSVAMRRTPLGQPIDAAAATSGEDTTVSFSPDMLQDASSSTFDEALDRTEIVIDPDARLARR